MKSLWFFLYVLMASQVVAQVQEFEDHMSLYHLNQSDVEDRLGYSCSVYTYSMEDNKGKEGDIQQRAIERYVRVVHKEKIERQDTWWGSFDSGSTIPAMIKSNTLRGREQVFRTRRNGIMQISNRPRGKLGIVGATDAYEPMNVNEWFYSPFEIGYQQVPSVYINSGLGHSPLPYVKCIKTEENGCTVWWNLASIRSAALRIAYDKEVEYLPRSVIAFKSETEIPLEDFKSKEAEWQKKKFFEYQIEWHKLESEDLYVPKHIRGQSYVVRADGFAGNDVIDIYYKNWKVGDAVDKTLLDEDEFKKLDVRQFPFEELIKAFPEHPPAVVR